MRLCLPSASAVVLVLASLAFPACQSGASDTAHSWIPELLERPEAIHNGKEWDKVRNLYVGAQQTLQKDSTNVAARLELARVFILEARITGEHGHYYPGAMSVLEGALRQNSLTPDERYQALTMLASVQLSQHEFAQALTTSEQAVRLNPYAAVGYGAIVDSYVELGKYEEAVKAADQMVKVKPDLRSYARVSYLREIHGRIDDALASMRLALDAGYPGTEETSWVRLTLGDILRQYGRRDEARDQYMMALEDRPGYPFAQAALAELAADEGDYEEAENMLKEAAAAVPEVGFYTQLVHIYRATDRPELAESTLAEVMDMLADDVAHGHNMNLEYAEVYLNLTGELDKALDYAQREYERRPDNIDVNRMLSTIYLLQGNYDKSQEHATVAARTGSRHPDLELTQGLLALHKGDQVEAKRLLASSKASQPNPPAALAAALAQAQG